MALVVGILFYLTTLHIDEGKSILRHVFLLGLLDFSLTGLFEERLDDCYHLASVFAELGTGSTRYDSLLSGADIFDDEFGVTFARIDVIDEDVAIARNGNGIQTFP